MQEGAKDLQSWTRSNTKALREGMGDKAYEAYQEIVDLQARGDFRKARDLEEQFYSDFGGSPEANFLLSHLRKDKVGAGFEEGLEMGNVWMRQFKGSGARKAKKLLDITLEQFGIRDTRRLLDRKTMQAIKQGGDPEEITRQLLSGLTQKQKDRMKELGYNESQLMEELQGAIGVAGGAEGATGEELRRHMAGRQVQQAYGTRTDDQAKEEVSTPEASLSELKKMNSYMKMLLQTTEKGNQLLSAVEDAARESGNDGGGGDGGGPGGGTNKGNPR
jgi:hypothetical protein